VSVLAFCAFVFVFATRKRFFQNFGAQFFVCFYFFKKMKKKYNRNNLQV